LCQKYFCYFQNRNNGSSSWWCVRGEFGLINKLWVCRGLTPHWPIRTCSMDKYMVASSYVFTYCIVQFNVRMKQSEVTKRNISSACKSARKMCRYRVIVSGSLPVRGSDELYSRVSQFNCWLKTVFCPSQKIEFVDNWPSFWVTHKLAC
jgi:hypothetical protein